MKLQKIILAVIVISFFTTLSPALSSESNGAWELYVVPEKYTINLGEELKLGFGFTGYGNIDPLRFKVVAYSENDTVIQYKDSRSSKNFNTFTIYPINNDASSTRFTKRQQSVPDYTIALLTDYDSQLDWLKLHPESSGNKKLTLIATYFVQGDGWRTTKCEFDYHVNTRVEEFQTLITVISIILALLSISFLPSVGMRICGAHKNKSDKRRHP